MKGGIIIGLLVLVFVLAFMRRVPQPPKESFVAVVSVGASKPPLWWVVDTDSNARRWLDFSARNSNLPNRGYLQVALQAVQRTQGSHFRIVPLIGRDEILAHIPTATPNAKQLPPDLFRAYVMAQLLETHGGLVMDGNSTLCIGPSINQYVQKVPAAMFGVNPDEPVVSPATTVAPGPAPYAGWSAEPNHPAWSYAASEYRALVERGPQAFSAASARRLPMILWEKQHELGAIAVRSVDGSRLRSGKLRTLDDYFGRVSIPADPNQELLPDTVYISYNGDELERSAQYSWFMRMSPEQIKESSILWAKYAGY